MPILRLFTITASCVVSLALFLMAGDKLLTFLNVDLIATLLRASPLARPLETNEAAVIAEARRLAAGGALALAIAMVVGFFHALRRRDSLPEVQDRLARTLQEQELALVTHYRELGVQLTRSRDALSIDMSSMGEVGAATQNLRGALELRFASVESSLQRMDDALESRLESLAAQVSHSLRASDSQRQGQVPQDIHAIEQRLARIDSQLDHRLGGIESRLQSTGEELSARYVELSNQIAQELPRAGPLTREIDAEVHAVRARLDQLDQQLEQLGAQWQSGALQIGSQLTDIDQRLAGSAEQARVPDPSAAASQVLLEQLGRRVEGIEAQMRASGERMGTQLTDLSQRMSQVQSVNSSTFGDFNTQPAPLNGTTGTLQSMILNLAHLQVDLRAERSALRKRLRDLPAQRQS